MEDTKDIESVRKRLHMKAFYMMFEMAAVIALPALLVVGVGNYFEVPRNMLIVYLVIAFILSWVIIIMRVRMLGRELKTIDAKIKADKVNKAEKE